MDDSKLRKEIIKLAHENPEIREDLLPLLKEAQVAFFSNEVPIIALALSYMLQQVLMDRDQESLPMADLEALSRRLARPALVGVRDVPGGRSKAMQLAAKFHRLLDVAKII